MKTSNTMNTPRISIIIPCYNQGKYLKQTINSVLHQTFQDFEIIIVNDGSSDKETLDILEESKWDKTHIFNIKNSGVAFARNTAIAHAKGKYILPLDGDDLIAPTYLEKAATILDSDKDIKVATCQVRFFGKAKGIYNLPEYSLEGLMGQNLLVVTSLFRKCDFDLTPGYNENMKGGFEDWDLWLSLLKNGGKVYKINDVLFFYRISKNSRNSSISLEMQSKLRRQIYENHIDLYNSKFLNPLLTFEYINLRNSKEYWLGNILLRPIRKILNMLEI